MKSALRRPEVETTRGRKPISPGSSDKQIVEVAMFCDLVARRLLNRAISIFEADTQGAVGFLHAGWFWFVFVFVFFVSVFLTWMVSGAGKGSQRCYVR